MYRWVIRAGFLDPESLQDLIELARDGSAEHRLARQCECACTAASWIELQREVASHLLLDDDTVRHWYKLYEEDGVDGLAESFEAMKRQLLPSGLLATGEAQSVDYKNVAAFKP